MTKTKNVYVPRVRDTGENPKHDGKAFRVRTNSNRAGQYGTRKWAEEALADALANDHDLERVGVSIERIPVDVDAEIETWLTGFVPLHKVDPKHRPRYRRTLQAAANAARDAGRVVHINSSYRTRKVQERLYANYLAGGALAARPGTSEHELGGALDISDLWINRKLARAFRKHGFVKSVPSERWHASHRP